MNLVALFQDVFAARTAACNLFGHSTPASEDVPFSDDEDDESNEVCSIDSQTDWMESLMDTRTESRTQAHENIRSLFNR